MKKYLCMVIAFLVICILPISNVNASELQSEISYNGAVTIDNNIVINNVEIVSITYGFEIQNNIFGAYISLKEEARPPTLIISKVYESKYIKNDYLIDVGKIYSQVNSAHRRILGGSRKPRDGIIKNHQSYWIKY